MPPYARMVAWLASLAFAAREHRIAESYMLELLSWCTFSDRVISSNDD